LLDPHLGHTSMIVIILRVSIIIFVDVVSGAKPGRRVKNKRSFFGGLKTRVIFYEKDKNRIAKLEVIIYKRRSYHSIYRGIYTGKLAGHISTVIQKQKKQKKGKDFSLDSNLQANKILSP